VQQANPGVRLHKPNWQNCTFAYIRGGKKLT
jgi:hypothetical protein